MLASVSDEAQLAAAIRVSAGGEGLLDRVGPVNPAIARFPLAVTALNDFARCPRLFRLRYELALPPLARAPDSTRPGRGEPLDPLRLGTLLHRCMELYRPGERVCPRSLLSRAGSEFDGDPTVLEAIEPLLAGILAQAGESGLDEMLAGADRVHRELDFVSRLGPAELRGQIDLLCRDAEGQWRLIDYKSDRLDGANPESHGRAYRLQLAVYADAARRFLGAPVAAAGLYFLRSGQWAWLSQAESALSEADRVVAQLATARRTGTYRLGQDQRCRGCPYGPMCRPGQTG
jgi:RecB family exonuclease